MKLTQSNTIAVLLCQDTYTLVKMYSFSIALSEGCDRLLHGEANSTL
ncbi:MAG TPA: hypothetical protein VK184_20750 [Nostocaceae cyanobacterium]|nr:hypothetical protein [Nostocaceae cyanobacterium]